jgi:hypothetical protein
LEDKGEGRRKKREKNEHHYIGERGQGYKISEGEEERKKRPLLAYVVSVIGH